VQETAGKILYNIRIFIMWKPFFSNRTLIVLFSTFALINVTACSNNQTANFLNQKENSVETAPVASAAEPPAKPKQSAASPQVQQPEPSKAADTYQQAIDSAMGAITISKSAVSRDDWSLAANHWQKATQLLKAVPTSSRQYKTAQKNLTEYQGYLADAKLRATPRSQKSCADTKPEFFSVPVKGRLDGTPIVEVTINDHKFDMFFDTGASKTLITLPMAYALKLPAVGIGKMRIANGSVVILPIALVKSQEIDGRFRIDVPVAVAPAAGFGLLGQDFYKGYDVAIKENVIEFRRQGSDRSVNQGKATCLVDAHPKFFSVPITRRKNNIPIVEVSFNDRYTFPMLFDTGASTTLITRSMAVKMGLKPVGIGQAELADGSVASFAIALIKSKQMAGRVQRNVPVSVAPPAMDIGLLGQDFFEGYNYTIKENVIEFSRQEL
jgi:predicted aspartyl protease